MQKKGLISQPIALLGSLEDLNGPDLASGAHWNKKINILKPELIYKDVNIHDGSTADI